MEDCPTVSPTRSGGIGQAIQYYWTTSLTDGLAPGLLPPIAAPEIRRAARTFPEGTAAGPDGWKPRDIGLLSDDALLPLAGLFNAAEVAAYPLGDLVDIVFLPQPGGERPIVLIRTLLRLWCRCRRKCAREWERLNDRIYFWAAEERSSEEAVHHQGLAMEAAKARSLFLRCSTY